MSPSSHNINHQIRNLWFAIWLMPIAICAIAILWQITQLRPEVVEAQSFKLIDANGRELARMEAVDGGVMVALLGSGVPRVKWLLREDDGPVAVTPEPFRVSGVLEAR